MNIDPLANRIPALELLGVQQNAEAAAESDTDVAAAKFEEMFASMLVKEMRKGLDEGFFGQGPGAGVFEGWLDRIVGEALVRGKGLGIADAMQRSLDPASPNERDHR